MRQTNPTNNARLITIGMVLLFLFLLVSFLRVYFKDYELRKEIARTQQDVNKLEKRKIESIEVLKHLQTDAYVEDRAREELQATQPGETVLVVPGLTVTSTANSSIKIESDIVVPLSNPEKWWYYFFRPQDAR